MRSPEARSGLARTAALFDQVHRYYANTAGCCRADDALLCHLLECNLDQIPVNSTDLVRLQRFGTLPTLTSRLARLSRDGLIEQVVAEDRRVRLLRVTGKGVALLEARDRLFKGWSSGDSPAIA